MLFVDFLDDSYKKFFDSYMLFVDFLDDSYKKFYRQLQARPVYVSNQS